MYIRTYSVLLTRLIMGIKYIITYLGEIKYIRVLQCISPPVNALFVLDLLDLMDLMDSISLTS